MADGWVKVVLEKWAVVFRVLPGPLPLNYCHVYFGNYLEDSIVICLKHCRISG